MSALRSVAAGVVVLASVYLVFVAVVGYGFGQLFFGTFSLVSTICALSALGSVFGAALCAGWKWCQASLAFLSLVAIICFVLEVIDYYQRLDIPGNYFAWGMLGPFVASLLIIFAANLYGHFHRPNKSLERTRER